MPFNPCACAVLLLGSIHLSTSSPETPLCCSRQGLRCNVSRSNCMDSKWLENNVYTPSAPEDLEVGLDVRRNRQGDIFPVIHVRWKLKDEGSISHLKATEMHIHVQSTNENLCVRYTFFNQLPMKNPSGEKWSFFVDEVVEPGKTYLVSVLNLPKPELNHTSYDVVTKILVPDCEDPGIKSTKFCAERGSLWHPNVTLEERPGGSTSRLSLIFSTHQLAERYRVLLKCLHNNQLHKNVYKNNLTSLNVTFDLEDWPKSCCTFYVEIQPFFPKCENDCTRRRETVHLCTPVMVIPIHPESGPANLHAIIASIGLVLLCAVMGCILYAHCKPKNGQTVAPVQDVEKKLPWDPSAQPPKLLVIYSQDHRLYRDVVLKLCAFLRSKCGMEVLVDLLDNTMVGTVGPVRWLEWQKRQLKNPRDKILVLCSRGVQAKWRAMCGQGSVMLREDVLSPTDDMLIPFLNLFLSDIHQPAPLSRYIVAYFEDISGEWDVPSVFNIAAKYRLMKHFEELYFRVLRMEKYEPGRVNHIKGIGGEEYFECDSGKALRDAIETFKAYQLENPAWFETECVESEEVVVERCNALNVQPDVPSVLECIPLINQGPPACAQEVEIHQNDDSVYVVTPELSAQCRETSVMELKPRVNAPFQGFYRLNSLAVSKTAPRAEPIFAAEPDLRESPSLMPVWQNWPCPLGEAVDHHPAEDRESPSSSIGADPQRLVAPWRSAGSDLHLPPPDPGYSLGEPIEMDEEELLTPNGKAPSSGSDQGYISKVSSESRGPAPGSQLDPLLALARLQEELFQTSQVSMEMHEAS